MPYSSYVSGSMKNIINRFYSVSQILATMNMLFSETIDKPFMILFAIQIAAFLMTLVRKSILSGDGWHILYASSLLLNFVYSYYTHENQEIVLYWRVAALFCIMRFEFKINKYALWLLVAVICYNTHII
jgi:hypothetical protein